MKNIALGILKYTLNVLLLLFYWAVLTFVNFYCINTIFEEKTFGIIEKFYEIFGVYLSFFFMLVWALFAILFLPVSEYLNAKYFKVKYLENFFEFFNKFWYLILISSIFISFYLCKINRTVFLGLYILLALNPIGVIINSISLKIWKKYSIKEDKNRNHNLSFNRKRFICSKLSSLFVKYISNFLLLFFYWIFSGLLNFALILGSLDRSTPILKLHYNIFGIYSSFFFILAWILFNILFLPVSEYLNTKYFKVKFLEDFFEFFTRFWYLILLFSIILYINSSVTTKYSSLISLFLPVHSPIGVIINWISLLWVRNKKQ